MLKCERLSYLKEVVAIRLHFIEILTLILIVLKLTGIINVSWLVVFMPVIVVIGIALIIWIVILLLGLLGYRSKTKNEREDERWKVKLKL